jgi:hypothetical protein
MSRPIFLMLIAGLGFALISQSASSASLRKHIYTSPDVTGFDTQSCAVGCKKPGEKLAGGSCVVVSSVGRVQVQFNVGEFPILGTALGKT